MYIYVETRKNDLYATTARGELIYFAPFYNTLAGGLIFTHTWQIPRGRGLHTTPPQPLLRQEERLTRLEVFHDLCRASPEDAPSWVDEQAALGYSRGGP
jgi:hypothetical protein